MKKRYVPYFESSEHEKWTKENTVVLTTAYLVAFHFFLLFISIFISLCHIITKHQCKQKKTEPFSYLKIFGNYFSIKKIKKKEKKKRINKIIALCDFK